MKHLKFVQNRQQFSSTLTEEKPFETRKQANGRKAFKHPY